MRFPPAHAGAWTKTTSSDFSPFYNIAHNGVMHMCALYTEMNERRCVIRDDSHPEDFYLNCVTVLIPLENDKRE